MRLCALLLLAACSLDVEPSGGLAGGGSGGGGTQPEISFALDILPLFQQDCQICHGGAGGLNLDNYEGVIAGGVSGPVVNPGDGANSLLVRRPDGCLPPGMPRDGEHCTTTGIGPVAQWIDEGALDN